ncbi:MAG: hypothetical protein ACJAS4_000922 [Bacteriovoracaceae bacterium]|jgi:hypothetical protein
MKKQNETNKNKNTNFFSSLRVKKGTKDNALKILDTINKKDFGRKVSIDDLVTKALENVTKEDIELLQRKSLRNKDRQAIVHQFYCKKVKKVSEDEFIGITMSSDYFDFLEKNKADLQNLGI